MIKAYCQVAVNAYLEEIKLWVNKGWLHIKKEEFLIVIIDATLNKILASYLVGVSFLKP